MVRRLGSATRLLTGIALAVAFLVFVLPPAIYFGVAYSKLAAVNQTRAAHLAHDLSRLVAGNPVTWEYQEHRFEEVLQRLEGQAEATVVRNAAGTAVVRRGAAARPTIIASATLFDAGRPVGRLEVEQSLRGTLAWTLLAALGSLLLAATVYLTLRILPLRSLQHALDALAAQQLRAGVTLRSIGDAVITIDAAGRVDYLNPVAERLTGWTSAQAVGHPFDEVARLASEMDGRPVPSFAAEAAAAQRAARVPAAVVLVHRDGEKVPVEGIVTPIEADQAVPGGAVVVLHDVTNTRQMTRRLSYQASHDALTGLVNRHEFERRLEEGLVAAREAGQEHAVCYIDLDQFKIVNDTCGHGAGDELLRQVAVRLKERIRGADVLARLGGDEFGVLLYGCGLERARDVAESLLDAVRDLRFVWHDKTFTVGASIGVASIGAAAPDVATVLSGADAACYLAKNQGRNRVQVDVPEDAELSRQRGEMSYVARLTGALDEGRFVLYQQRVAPLQPGARGGEHMEILLRMVGEDGGHILPGAFIPAAERYGLMPRLDRWVIGEVFARFAALQRTTSGTVEMVAINLSGVTVGDPAAIDCIVEQARRHAIPAERICFELTETAAVNNLQTAVEAMRRLKACGFQLAIDDFGSGFTSFAFLKALQVDYVKIDGSYVKGMVDDRVDRAMVTAIRQIASVIGVKTIAEWVETPALAAELRDIGIDYAQGFGIARPAPFELLLDHRAA